MEENKNRLLDYLAKNGKDKSWADLAKQFGLPSGESARGLNRRNRSTTNFVRVGEPVLPGYTITTTVSKEPIYFTIDAETNTAKIESEEKLTTEEAVLEYCKLNPNEWEVKEIWTKEKQTKDLTHPLSVDGVLTLYETTAKILPKSFEKSLKEDFKDFVSEYVTNKRPVKTKRIDRSLSNILIISLTDLHFDKKSWYSETAEHGNQELSKSRAINACFDLVDRASESHDLQKIVILGGHDFFHANTSEGKTEKGTKLDVDGRWHESFKEGLTLMTTIIDYCLQVAPVDYYNVIGNHGPERDQYLAISLEAFYRLDPDVFIECTYGYRKYFSFGRSAFMLTHEVGSKAKELPILFAVEKPEMFAKCKYRTVLTGHLHKQHETQFVGTNENFGIVYKIMPSLSSSDQWHVKNGFVQNQKSCIALVVNKEYGTIAELIYNE